jgi:NTP pyrophosphatase (non-canonical NTP hydrolase)
MTLNELQQTVDSWIKQHGVRYFSELTNMAVLMEEVGEVSRHMARIYGEQSYKDPTDIARSKEMLTQELADVLFVLTCIANQTGINMQDAILTNLTKKTNRDANRHKDNPKLQVD